MNHNDTKIKKILANVYFFILFRAKYPTMLSGKKNNMKKKLLNPINSPRYLQQKRYSHNCSRIHIYHPSTLHNYPLSANSDCFSF